MSSGVLSARSAPARLGPIDDVDQPGEGVVAERLDLGGHRDVHGDEVGDAAIVDLELGRRLDIAPEAFPGIRGRERSLDRSGVVGHPVGEHCRDQVDAARESAGKGWRCRSPPAVRSRPAAPRGRSLP